MRIPFLTLQGKIIVVVFSEIQRFGFRGDPFTGRVTEFPTLMLNGYNTMFGAEHLILI